MNTTTVVLATAAVFAASWWLTGQLRAYALKREVIDHPNERSSHTVATPRGGGMAIATAMIVGVIVCGATGVLAGAEALAIAAGGAAVAAVGFIDDHRHIPAAWRLLAHFAAAGLALVLLTGLSSPLPWPPGGAWLGYALVLVMLVWVLNLTNFMDGIDGIAAIEAITVCLGGVLVDAIVAPAEPQWLAPLLLAAATSGFLVWNWPPARIFMGDGGSGFVGLSLGLLAVQAGMAESRLLWSWVILLAVFVTDASVTLARRTLRGEPVHKPHRTHAYQHAAVRLGRHAPVTMTVAAINVVWLWPLAVLVGRGTIAPIAGVGIAYAPLLLAALMLGSGAQRR